MEILKIQLTPYIIRMAADYLTLSETLEGIELVKSKYSDGKIDYNALDGFIKIYRRNVDKPVFGR